MKCCDIQSGNLRTTIQLQRRTDTDDGAGGRTVAWTTYAVPRAWMRPLSGMEQLASDRLEATQRRKAVIRYRSGVEPADRVLFKGQPMQIRAVLNIEERNKWLELDIDAGEAT